MNRRAFIGGLLGTVAATAVLPKASFLAQPESAEWQRIFLPYRVLFHDANSSLMLQGPAVLSKSRWFGISMKADGTYGYGEFVKLVTEPLVADVPLVVDRVVLLDEKARVRIDKCQSPIYLLRDDSLQVTFDIEDPVRLVKSQI